MDEESTGCRPCAFLLATPCFVVGLVSERKSFEWKTPTP